MNLLYSHTELCIIILCNILFEDYLSSITETGLPGFLVGAEEGLNNGIIIMIACL